MTDRIEEIRARHRQAVYDMENNGHPRTDRHDERGHLLDTLAARDAEIERLKAVGDGERERLINAACERDHATRIAGELERIDHADS